MVIFKLFSMSKLSAIILMKKPKKGGSPAKERKLIKNIIFGIGDKFIL